jgi:hypothetical protein
MKLKELVEFSNKCYRSTVGASLLLGMGFIMVAALYYLKSPHTSDEDFKFFMAFMACVITALLLVLLYSLCMLSEVSRKIIMSYRVLSQITESSATRFVNLYTLDTLGFPVLSVLKEHNRFDLIERYYEELVRIRKKYHKKLYELHDDHDARRNCQSSYDAIAQLATWMLFENQEPKGVHKSGE